MKTIKKIKINKEKLMTSNELMNLKGGYDGSSKCYSEGWLIGCGGDYLGDVNFCDLDTCASKYGGHCVTC